MVPGPLGDSLTMAEVTLHLMSRDVGHCVGQVPGILSVSVQSRLVELSEDHGSDLGAESATAHAVDKESAKLLVVNLDSLELLNAIVNLSLGDREVVIDDIDFVLVVFKVISHVLHARRLDVASAHPVSADKDLRAEHSMECDAAVVVVPEADGVGEVWIGALIDSSSVDEVAAIQAQDALLIRES